MRTHGLIGRATQGSRFANETIILRQRSFSARGDTELDDLGNYLLRRTQDFMELALSQEARRKIQDQLAAARQQEEAELASAEHEAQCHGAEQKESRRNNPFRRS